MVQGIRQLEAGSWMRIRHGRPEARRYWDVVADGVQFDFSDEGKVQRRIRELMLQSVRRRLVSDVPVGAFLSGGIDSSAVAGLMAEADPARPNTFNICFDEKEYDESAYAEMVAKKFNTEHTRILLRPTDFLDELPHALDAMDSPSGDGINTYVVSKAIRSKGIKVALSGVGGDELFAGYPYFGQYLQVRSKGWLWKLPAFLRGMAALAQSGGKRKRLQQVLRAESPAIEAIYPVFRQILAPEEIGRLTALRAPGGLNGERLPGPGGATQFPGPDGATQFPGPGGLTCLEATLAGRSAELSRLPLLSQVSAAEYLGYTQHTLLKDTDQMSMAVALEVREPFFDQDLVEFVLAVPDRLKKPVYPKSLLVESLKPLLPEEIVFRKKQGFLFPWNVWLKKELRSFCEDQITRMAGRDFIHGGELKARWKQFLAGDPRVRWSEIWLFVVLEYWLEKNGVS
jgi:asparagine synthase (glutamine-hydrolysing)